MAEDVTYQRQDTSHFPNANAGCPHQPPLIEICYEPQQAYTRAQEIFATVPRGYLLPYYVADTRSMEPAAILAEIYQYAGKMDYSAPGKQAPVVLSPVTHHGEPGYAVLFSEFPVTPFEPYSGTREYYRFCLTEDAVSIRKHGFFQLPGRDAFYSHDRKEANWTSWLAKGKVAVVFDLEHTQVYQSCKGSACLTFPRSGRFEACSLPAEIKAPLGELIFNQAFRTRESHLHVLRRHVLLAGEWSGALLRIPAEQINVERTLAKNRMYLERDKITLEDYEQLAEVFAAS